MLDLPWPPVEPGPQQPRDAHAPHWSNDVRRLAGGTRGTGPSPAACGAWDELHDRAPVVRGRAGDMFGRRDASDTLGRDRDAAAHDTPRPEAARPAPQRLPARWVPQEEWIPDPTPSPEQRWTPEQDWLAVFAAAAPTADAAPTPAARRASTLRWLVAGGSVLLIGLAAIVVALL